MGGGYKPVHNPWISVKDRLPQEYDLVEVYHSDGKEHFAYIDQNTWEFGRRVSKAPITHWRSQNAKPQSQGCNYENWIKAAINK